LPHSPRWNMSSSRENTSSISMPLTSPLSRSSRPSCYSCTTPCRTHVTHQKLQGQEEHCHVCSSDRSMHRAALPGAELDECSHNPPCS
jgi:hypothetical protein